MGKSSSKIIETLVVPYQPVRYLVTNTEKVILVTYDYKYATRLADAIRTLENPSKFIVKLK